MAYAANLSSLAESAHRFLDTGHALKRKQMLEPEVLAVLLTNTQLVLVLHQYPTCITAATRMHLRHFTYSRVPKDAAKAAPPPPAAAAAAAAAASGAEEAEKKEDKNERERTSGYELGGFDQQV